MQLSVKQINTSVFVLFFLSLMTGVRYRFGDKNDFHFGGAEFALSPYDIPLMGIVILFFRGILAKKITIRWDFLDLSALFFIVICGFSLITSMEPAYTSFEVLRQLKFFIVYLWLRDVFSENHGRETFYNGVLIALIIQGILVYLQIITGTTIAGDGESVDLNMISGGIVRVAGSFGHPGVLAQYINIILAAAFIKWIAFEGRYKYLYLLAWMLGLNLLIFTYSRTGLATQFIIFFIIIYAYSNIDGDLKKLSKYIPFVSVLVVGVVVYNFDSIYERFIEAPSESGEVRVLLSSIAVSMFEDNPIFGVGLNAFTEVMSEYDNTGLSHYWEHPVHNIYLLNLSELGLLGFISFLMQLIIFSYSAYKIVTDKNQPVGVRYFTLTGLMGLFSIMLYGLFGWSWRLDSIQGLYWITLSIIASSFSYKNKA